ncbi:hypothetical protein MUA02_18970 [Enterobacteriaceae bacterium H20N1]|uniref:Uncharacterized protein n=1 Tax=Dryocola boscaweniae TaxID=2925397 RepID=A0A9X3ACR5_9ENTR|nr:hypothetical protein [Dryocola boscaweniae]MCT4703939.1 hypothetical protein [Dryocola boscaweniae]MCT4717117.1 hypothetical protein [Dryocola boscaweniae]MCT4721107.1 hypothetical protein [Dryocola boscaweniae]
MRQDEERAQLIGCAIGAAVVSLIAEGTVINRDNIIDELYRQGKIIGDGIGSAISHEAVEIVMRGQ